MLIIFFRPSASPYIQALNFTNLVELEENDLPPVLDVETLNFDNQNQLIENMTIWLNEVSSFYGVRPIIYTNVNFYNRYLAGYFPEYPLWIARYNTKEPTLACGQEWQFWQYGNRGKVEGINGYVDMNVFHGTDEDLNNLSVKSTPVLSGEISITSK